MIIRQTTLDDASELSEILNEIIKIGGTTAMEEPLDIETLCDYFINGSNCVCCFTAENDDGLLVGFQALETKETLPDDCANIATFARQTPKTPGVGTALLEKTIEYAKKHQFSSINATIREDNVPGLAYYAKMGFEDHSISKDVPLKSGTPVNRIHKRYDLK